MYNLVARDSPMPRGHTSQPLHTHRGEIMQAAQRRDIPRLRNMITTLIHQSQLHASQLNECLALHHGKQLL